MLAKPGKKSTTITVSPEITYQQIDGFGAAITHASAYLIDESPLRDKVLADLFEKSGARFNMVRVPIGTSDFPGKVSGVLDEYSLDESADGEDRHLNNFSVGGDTYHLIQVLKSALKRQPELSIIAAPWSAPAWMKIGGKFEGECSGANNYLKHSSTDSMYPTYARYLALFVGTYQKKYSLPITMVSMQNEPENCKEDYPTMNMTASDQARLAPLLRKELNAVGAKATRIMAYDHNWTKDNPYPQSVIAHGGKAVDAFGYHCYSHRDGGRARMQLPSPGKKDIYYTECSGSWPIPQSGPNLAWVVNNDLIGPLRNQARASLYWNMALTRSSQPHAGGCIDCRGLITLEEACVSNDNCYWRSDEYYLWSHFSKFVDRDAYRIRSTYGDDFQKDELSLDKDEPDGALKHIAFRNPDGSLILVVLNPSAQKRQAFTVKQGANMFSYSLPPTSVVTFDWKPATLPTRQPSLENRLVLKPGKQNVYLVAAGRRYPLPADNISLPCFRNRGYGKPKAITPTQWELLSEGTLPANCAPDPTSMNGKLVQADNDSGTQKTSWLVRDGKRYWISDTDTFECLNKNGAVLQKLPRYALDVIEDQNNQWAACIPGLEGDIVQWKDDPNVPKAAWLVKDGKRRWIPDTFSYQCFLNYGADGPIGLGAHALDWMPDQKNQWAYCIPKAEEYENHIVREASSGTAWLVKNGLRYWIETSSVYRCLQRRGAKGPNDLPSYVLDTLADQTGKWAVCR